MSTGACPASLPQPDNQITPNLGIHAKRFRRVWQAASADSALSLYGFRRFKTSHLLNLRLLEAEIADLDHVVYQAGLTLGSDHAPQNKLGLNYCKRDANVPAITATITEELVLKLRDLLKQYGPYPISSTLLPDGHADKASPICRRSISGFQQHHGHGKMLAIGRRESS